MHERDSTSLDLADAPGTVISAHSVLDEYTTRTLLELTGLLRLAATASGASVRTSVASLSTGELRWSGAIGRGAGVARPGRTFELALDQPAIPVCLQLVAWHALCVTVTVSLVARSPSRHVVVQALVGG
jgi:hypothetical protein